VPSRAFGGFRRTRERARGGEAIVYTKDTDNGDLYVVENYQ
jgi:hypothetical protein